MSASRDACSNLLIPGRLFTAAKSASDDMAGLVDEEERRESPWWNLQHPTSRAVLDPETSHRRNCSLRIYAGVTGRRVQPGMQLTPG